MFVVVWEVWLDGYVLEKFRHRAFVIACPRGRNSEIEMDEGEVGIGAHGALQLSEGSLRFLPVEIGFAHNQMKLSRVAADFHQALECFLVQLGLSCAVRGIAQNIEVHEVARHQRPERFKYGHRFCVMFRKKLAESKQVAGLF